MDISDLLYFLANQGHSLWRPTLLSSTLGWVTVSWFNCIDLKFSCRFRVNFHTKSICPHHALVALAGECPRLFTFGQQKQVATVPEKVNSPADLYNDYTCKPARLASSYPILCLPSLPNIYLCIILWDLNSVSIQSNHRLYTNYSLLILTCKILLLHNSIIIQYNLFW